MEQPKFLTPTNCEIHFQRFLEGNERGLEFFYNLLYPSLYYSGVRYIKDDVNANSIVSEAFLRLWLSRKNITSPTQIDQFLRKLIRDACRAYFRTSSNRFQHSLLRLDDMENYEEFLVGHATEIDEQHEPDQQNPGAQLSGQWKKIKAIIPNLPSDQQLFLRLCIKYSFDYGRIAFYIGGISDYQVAMKVERTIAGLKAIITDTQKLEVAGKQSKFRFEGDISEVQSSILHMRYQLQYSFSEIATALNLDQGYIQQAFAAASLKVRKVKVH